MQKLKKYSELDTIIKYMGRGQQGANNEIDVTMTRGYFSDKPYLKTFDIDESLKKYLGRREKHKKRLSLHTVGKLQELKEEVLKELSSVEFFYHLAPTTERNRIFQHGVIPSLPKQNDMWMKGALDHQPRAVYLTSSEETAREFKWFFNIEEDIWMISANQINSIDVDWEMTNNDNISGRAEYSFYTLNCIEPELLEKHEDTIKDLDWSRFSGIKENAPLSWEEKEQLRKEINYSEEYLNKK